MAGSSWRERVADGEGKLRGSGPGCLYRSGEWRGYWWHQADKPGIFCLTQLQIRDQLLQIKVILLRDPILVSMNFCHHFIDTLFYNFSSFHRLKIPPACRSQAIENPSRPRPFEVDFEHRDSQYACSSM